MTGRLQIIVDGCILMLHRSIIIRVRFLFEIFHVVSLVLSSRTCLASCFWRDVQATCLRSLRAWWSTNSCPSGEISQLQKPVSETDLSILKPEHTTGRSGRSARRGGGAGSVRTGRRQNSPPRRQASLVPSKASRTHRLNVSP